MSAFGSRTITYTAAVVIAVIVGFGGHGTVAQPHPQVLKLEGDVSPVHDPVVIKERDTYYVFATGGRSGQGVIPIRTSKDLRTWRLAGYVLESLPEWARTEIPQARNAWAPDILFFNDKYHLYYSVSSFGSRNSTIGLATSATLDPTSPNYKWVDDGIFSYPSIAAVVAPTARTTSSSVVRVR